MSKPCKMCVCRRLAARCAAGDPQARRFVNRVLAMSFGKVKVTPKQRKAAKLAAVLLQHAFEELKSGAFDPNTPIVSQAIEDAGEAGQDMSSGAIEFDAEGNPSIASQQPPRSEPVTVVAEQPNAGGA